MSNPVQRTCMVQGRIVFTIGDLFKGGGRFHALDTCGVSRGAGNDEEIIGKGSLIYAIAFFHEFLFLVRIVNDDGINVTAPPVVQGGTCAGIHYVQFYFFFLLEQGLEVIPQAGIVQAGSGGDLEPHLWLCQ